MTVSVGRINTLLLYRLVVLEKLSNMDDRIWELERFCSVDVAFFPGRKCIKQPTAEECVFTELVLEFAGNDVNANSTFVLFVSADRPPVDSSNCLDTR